MLDRYGNILEVNNLVEVEDHPEFEDFDGTVKELKEGTVVIEDLDGEVFEILPKYITNLSI